MGGSSFSLMVGCILGNVFPSVYHQLIRKPLNDHFFREERGGLNPPPLDPPLIHGLSIKNIYISRSMKINVFFLTYFTKGLIADFVCVI